MAAIPGYARHTISSRAKSRNAPAQRRVMTDEKNTAVHSQGKPKKERNVLSKEIRELTEMMERLRLDDAPKTIAALHVNVNSRRRILAAGGDKLAFGQLAIRAPNGQNTILLEGPRKAREADKHSGAPGVPGSQVKPFVVHKRREYEGAHGR